MIDLGTFVEGEIPEPLEYRFLDSTGEPIDLTGYTATFHMSVGGVPTDLTATVTSPDDGEVTHVWVDGELARQNDLGSLRCEFTVTNDTNTYTSDRMRGFIRAAIREPEPTP